MARNKREVYQAKIPVTATSNPVNITSHHSLLEYQLPFSSFAFDGGGTAKVSELTLKGAEALGIGISVVVLALSCVALVCVCVVGSLAPGAGGSERVETGIQNRTANAKKTFPIFNIQWLPSPFKYSLTLRL